VVFVVLMTLFQLILSSTGLSRAQAGHATTTIAAQKRTLRNTPVAVDLVVIVLKGRPEALCLPKRLNSIGK
jgi:hypothetical protein